MQKTRSDFSKKCKVKKDKEKRYHLLEGSRALAISNKKLIHAYGPMKKTIVMGITQTIKRIEKTAKLKVIGIKRL